MRKYSRTDFDGEEEIEMTEAQGDAAFEDKEKNVNFDHLTLQQKIFSRHSRHLPSRRLLTLSGKITGESSDMSSILPYATLRMPRVPNLIFEDHAVVIANHIEQNDKLMENNLHSEMLRTEILRDLPECLTVKRSIKAKLSYSASQKSKKKTVGYWKRLNYTISMTLIKFNTALTEIYSTMELWYHAIKSIEGHFGSGVAAYFKFLRWLFIVNAISCLVSIFFIVVPQSLISTHLENSFRVEDLLLGNGLFTNSIMYYGYYSNRSVETIPGKAYDIPSAYFFALSCCYLFTFVLLCSKVARSYRKCFIETSGGVYNQYATKIFCGWDYSISSSKAAKLCSASIYRELKELLGEAESDTDSSCFMKCITISIQILMTIFILATMVGTGGLLWILLNQHQTDMTNTWSVLLVPLIVTGIMNIFPSLISWLVKLEKYKNDRTALYVTVIRMYTMALVVIGTLLSFWLTRGNIECWQTQLAQDIYRLILIDFMISVIGIFLVQMLRSHLHTKLWRNIGFSKFDIAKNTMNLIYNQTLFWVAFYFSPTMSAVIVVKMMLTFYVKKFGLLTYCEPPSKPWRAAQTQTLFLALALLGMVGASIVLGYVIIYKETGDCGPFTVHNFTWEVIVEEVLLMKRDSLIWSICEQLFNRGSMSVVLLTMCISVYYLRAKAVASKQMVQLLREMLVMQSRDKEFLLRGFTQLTKKGCLRSSLARNGNPKTKELLQEDLPLKDIPGPSTVCY